MSRLRGLYIIESPSFEMVYGAAERAEIAAHVDIVAPQQTRESLAARTDLLATVEVLFLGWGAPVIDERFLSAAPNLRAIFYAAGAVGSWCTPAVFERGIVVTSAIHANSIPVAEYTLATILFSLKHGWALSRRSREERTFLPRDGAPGNFGSTVGLISAGAVTRALVPLLRPFDLKLVGHDPFVPPAEMRRLGLEPASLAQLFSASDVVSVHTPLLPETEGMITGDLLASMRPGSTFINTARGEIVREHDMVEVLRARPDLQAVLDVTAPEPPMPDSPLYSLPNVVLTPHIAGSVGAECGRLGKCMVEELGRYVRGEALRWQVRPELTAYSSHRPLVRGGEPRAATEGDRRVPVPA